MSYLWNTIKKYGGLFVTAASLVFLAGASALPVSATAPTVVTIQFDDGNLDQYAIRSVLTAHGMHATFYINTGYTGDATHLSWTQLQDLAADGNDIGGHTLTHINLKHVKTAVARQEICGDRVNLFNHGFQPVSFAYPFGAYDAGARQVVIDCGYNSGRQEGPGPETIPPLDAYATRRMGTPKQGTTLATIESYVTQVEQSSGGWVQIVFHHICDNCDAYSVPLAEFTAFLDWLQPRAANGTIVRTTADVIGGAVKPPVQP